MSEMAYGLTFVIHPDAESVSIGLFLRTIEDIHRLIRDLDYSVTREKGKRRWVIAALHASAPTITVKPLLDNDEIAETLVHGLKIVAAGTTDPPEHFTEEILDDLRRMRRLFVGRDKANRVVLSSNGSESAVIQEDIDQKADRILKGGYWNLGSVEGTLDAVNLHGSPSFTLWDRVSRSPVRCNFSKDAAWKERVKSLLEKRVLVVGRVNYFRNGIPRSVTGIENLEDMTPVPYLPKATFGSIPTPVVAESPAEFLKTVRGQEYK